MNKTHIRKKLLKQFLNWFWLRPESAILLSLRGAAYHETFKYFANDSLDVSCGDGVFSFIACGGEISKANDMYQSLDLSGGSKGKQGTVMSVDRKSDRVKIEGINMVKKHVKPGPANPQGGIESVEASIHISNVMVVDAAGNATRVGRRRGDDGKLVRYSKKTNEELK